jgi:branched-chain amino acid transport system substrate-binding protein
MKGFAERELSKAGIRLIATGDVTEDGVLEAMGDTPLGVVTTHHYSMAHNSSQNRAFLKAYADVAQRGAPVNFMGRRRMGRHGGDLWWYAAERPDRRGQGYGSARRLKARQPAGSAADRPRTRDPIQTVYVRRVQKGQRQAVQHRVRASRTSAIRGNSFMARSVLRLVPDRINVIVVRYFVKFSPGRVTTNGV